MFWCSGSTSIQSVAKELAEVCNSSDPTGWVSETAVGMVWHTVFRAKKYSCVFDFNQYLLPSRLEAIAIRFNIYCQNQILHILCVRRLRSCQLESEVSSCSCDCSCDCCDALVHKAMASTLRALASNPRATALLVQLGFADKNNGSQTFRLGWFAWLSNAEQLNWSSGRAVSAEPRASESLLIAS